MPAAAASTLASWPWSMYGVLFSVVTWPITLAFIIFYNRRPERRISKLKHPVSAHFIVPSARYHSCSYARQNEHEHMIKTLVVKSHSIFVVDMVIKAHIHFRTSQIYIGCYESDLEKPEPIEICNRFITSGKRRQSKPGDGNDDYLDKYGYYHQVESASWSINSDRALGFKFKSDAPGIYTLRIFGNYTFDKPSLLVVG
jgi:hypothetical protein